MNRTTARSFYNSAVYTEHYLGIRWPVAVWASVLQQAIADIVDGPPEWELRPCGDDLHARRKLALDMRAAAEHWIEDDANEPRRFVWVCEQLGLEPSYVRRCLAERRRPEGL